MDAFTAGEVPQTAEEVRRCSGPCTVAGGRATAVPILSLWRRERRQIDGIGRHKCGRLLCSGKKAFVVLGCGVSYVARWTKQRTRAGGDMHAACWI